MQQNSVITSKQNGYQFLIETLTQWGITHYTGMTGGGVIHFLKYIQAYNPISIGASGFMTLSEYSAGFCPLGYFLASGRYSAAVATTGAATKLLGCGLSDAKLHDIPAVFIVAQSEPKTCGLSPLQDTSEWGSNMIAQLRCELPEGVFVLDNPITLVNQLYQAQYQLENKKPIVFVLVHSALIKPFINPCSLPNLKRATNQDEIHSFISSFRDAVKGKKITILVGEEMSIVSNAKEITTKLSSVLHAATLWSLNGANAVDRENAYGYGYISFGGNDKAIEWYQNLDQEDVLLILGACPDEYTVNLRPFNAYRTFYLSHITDPYGRVSEHLLNHTKRNCEFYVGKLELFLNALISAAQKQRFEVIKSPKAPLNLNSRVIEKPQKGYVDMALLYQILDSMWPENAIGFNDICLAYKDRQYVIQRPNNRIAFYSLYRGSAMGGAFGLAIGARMASPEKPIYCFTGDGCFRLFSGSLGEARHLGLVIFLLNNESLSIVSQGIPSIIPNLPKSNSHTDVIEIDYCSIAKANGWHAVTLSSDLSELHDLLITPLKKGDTSLFVNIVVDPSQILGQNPRAKNL